MASISDVEKQISELKQQHKLLSEQLEWMQMMLKMVGVDGPWVTPSMAAAATGRCIDRIKDDIQLAERLRAEGKKSDLIYGVHYRND